MPLAVRILICVVAAEILGGIGGFITSGSIGSWYADLLAPAGTPPNSVFGPVWATLYAAIGISAALVWHRAPAGREKRRAFGWFALQAVLNLSWTPLFFGARRLDLALVVILALLVAIAVNIRSFQKLDRAAAALLVPYFLWVAYATYLNAGFLILNS